MEQRGIGALSVSVVGLGCNNFGRRLDARASAAVVDAALDSGINYFDTADVYGDSLSEEHLGRALGGRRNGVVIATKFGAPGSADEGVLRGSSAWVRTAAERSLRRLGTDRIDHYQLHFPDPEVPIEETLGELHRLVQEGKVREIGSSNFGSGRIREASDVAAKRGWTPFCTVQNRYSVLHRGPEPKVVPECIERRIGLIPYFPLESGLLTGKYRKAEALPDRSRLAQMPEDQRSAFLEAGALDKVERLRVYAESRGHTLLELAISWLASSPAVVSVIAGATRPDQVKANAAGATWKMTEAERGEIDALVT
jgi:aryl-alcohol dehydrogenase-like predicted oxidoreductase